MALIVETVRAATMAGLRAARDAALEADLVELRLDGVDGLDVAGALADRRRPVIVTCRPVWEGGQFDGSETERLAILRQAIALGAEYVDVEWRADRRLLPSSANTTTVISHHDFETVPTDLAAHVRAMRDGHDGVVKIAVTAARLIDCLTLRDAVAGDPACVAIAMGPAGWMTRTWPAGFGSCWTYGGAAAPGQMPVSDLIGRFRVRDTTAATAVYGIAGQPLAHSASPAMHNAAFAALGLDAVYLPMETSDADDLLGAANALPVQGLSVTAPLKEALARRVRADDAAARIGAVNTLRAAPGAWEGRNFDVAGFLAPLAVHAPRVHGARALVLGAGGGARAAAAGLKSLGAQVHLCARRPEQARRLAAELEVGVADWPPRPPWDVLVNATPVGTWPDIDAMPIDAATTAGALVYDLVYNPIDTALLRAARQRGARTIGGLDMLVDQACRQFAWWTGREAPAAVIRQAAEQFVTQESHS